MSPLVALHRDQARALDEPGVGPHRASLRFFMTGIYQLTGAERWEATAGIVGLLLAALALYAAYASGLEDSMKKTVLPMGRRSRGKQAVEGSPLEQLQNVRKERGVRQQL